MTENNPILNLDRWRLFTIVAKLGSLSKASVMLDRPQSVISRQINALENECGARLFYRTGRGVLVSEVGQAILPSVLQLLQDADQIMLNMRGQRGVAVGKVTIGLLPSLTRHLAALLVRRITEQFPKIQLHLLEANTGQLAEMIATGACDLALLLREPSGNASAEEFLVNLPTYLIGPPGDPLTAQSTVDFSKLDGLPLVLSGPPNTFRVMVEHAVKKSGVSSNIIADIDSLTIQREIVKAGIAHTVMTRFAVAEEVKRGELQAALIVKPTLESPVVLAMTTQRPPTLAMRETFKVLRTLARRALLKAAAKTE